MMSGLISCNNSTLKTHIRRKDLGDLGLILPILYQISLPWQRGSVVVELFLSSFNSQTPTVPHSLSARGVPVCMRCTLLILVGDHLASHKIEGRLSVTRQQVRKLGPKSPIVYRVDKKF